MKSEKVIKHEEPIIIKQDNFNSGAADKIMPNISKKTAYDVKEASNQSLSKGARKHYAENAQAGSKTDSKKGSWLSKHFKH